MMDIKLFLLLDKIAVTVVITRTRNT